METEGAAAATEDEHTQVDQADLTHPPTNPAARAGMAPMADATSKGSLNGDGRGEAAAAARGGKGRGRSDVAGNQNGRGRGRGNIVGGEGDNGKANKTAANAKAQGVKADCLDEAMQKVAGDPSKFKLILKAPYMECLKDSYGLMLRKEYANPRQQYVKMFKKWSTPPEGRNLGLECMRDFLDKVGKCYKVISPTQHSDYNSQTGKTTEWTSYSMDVAFLASVASQGRCYNVLWPVMFHHSHNETKSRVFLLDMHWNEGATGLSEEELGDAEEVKDLVHCGDGHFYCVDEDVKFFQECVQFNGEAHGQQLEQQAREEREQKAKLKKDAKAAEDERAAAEFEQRLQQAKDPYAAENCVLPAGSKRRRGE